MPTIKDDLNEAFKGTHQANQNNFANAKTCCAQAGLQTPKTPNKYYNNETILTNNSQ